MAMTCVAALIAASSIGMLLFGEILPVTAWAAEFLSIAFAALTTLAIASAAALDI